MARARDGQSRTAGMVYHTQEAAATESKTEAEHIA